MPHNRRHRFPEEFGLTRLYKYRPYVTPADRRRVHEILLEHKVWFSTSSKLNDPADLKPLLKFRRGRDDHAIRDEILADAERRWRRHAPPLSVEQWRLNRQYAASAPLETLEQEAMERAHRRLENYWILALASSSDSPRMWTEYAAQGRGVCIHFHVRPGSPFSFAQKVIYQTEQPVLLVPFRNVRNAQVGDMATCTKLLKWQDEAEFRWIRYPDRQYSETGFRFDGQHAHFPSTSIAGITIGDQLPHEDADFLRSIARKHDPPLPTN